MASQNNQDPLRFHLLIGAASSGKSTAARLLTHHLQGVDHQRVHYISSTAIRRDLYGDPAYIGRWSEVEAVIHQQLLQAIAQGATVILEASYVRRPYRLAITQALPLPVPVQWIGWWLDTPLEQCLAWNRQRDRQLPEWVIERHCAQLLQSAQVPHRQEGFALVLRLETGRGVPLETLIGSALQRLEGCLQRGTNRDAAYRLHGYSRLLDLERLLYLIHLLSSHPKLTTTDGANDQHGDRELTRLLSPLPAAGLPERAAALLGRLHGACYADPAAVAADLAWLEQQGFCQPWLDTDITTLPPINPPPWPASQPRPMGGVPRLGERAMFVRSLSLLRHLLLHPHDLKPGERVAEHLARSLNATTESPGRCTQDLWTARKVQAALSETLVPYGFRLPHCSGRHGYALGTALLSMSDLCEACALLELQAHHLGDSRAAALSSTLRQRLERSGAAGGQMPLRRWITSTTPLPQATSNTNNQAAGQLELIETAIAGRQRLLLSPRRSSHTASPITGDQAGWGGGPRAQPVWPLQLLLHAGRWWLLVEHDAIGQPHGLLSALELSSVHVFQRERLRGRDQRRHQQALERAQILEQRCGGLCFGEELAGQQALCDPDPSVAQPWMERLCIRCSPTAMAQLRRELDRFPASAIRLPAALPGHSWGRPERGSRALIASNDPRLPYPVEIDLPRWVMQGDPELRRWLFAYGPELRIEAPAALVEEHQRWLVQALQGYPLGGAGLRHVREGSQPPLNRRRIRKRLAPRRTSQKRLDPGS